MPKIKKAAERSMRQAGDTASSEIKKVVRPSRPPERWRWNFSFRFWTQIGYFGLSGIEAKWFASLLERFRQLSGEEIEKVRADRNTADQYRYHKINWNAKKIPISKSDLSHVPPCYLDDADYEFFQFQVSTSLGRVIGFFDEAWVFNIVLLDPLHNLQPSKDFDYRVTPSFPLSCELTAVRENIRAGLEKCNFHECAAKNHFEKIANEAQTHFEEFQVLMIKLDDPELMESAKNLVEKGKVGSLAEILEMGVIVVESSN